MDEILNKIDPSLRSKKTTELVPSWVKNNAGWWADGIVGDNEFVQSIQFLIKEKILVIPLVETKTSTSQEIPSWVKNNAGWWAKGEISEADFLNGIKHLIQTGLISTDSEAKSDGKNDIFQECESIKSAYTRLGCEKEIKQKIEFEDFKNKSTGYTVGSTIFYYPEIGNFGNELEISTGGQALLRLRIMVENTGTDNITLMCTGPSICNYDVWDGSKAFKYAGMDFVSGQIVIKPKTSFIFNIMFGPNIGYGGTTFEFDETKEYYFRINESWGKTTIPLNLSK
ncbi:MAG: peptidase [Nitrosopumilus sp.]|nr:peptidase [Nitrosopumilus sp.]NNL58440.1 peptidase [Nitrosopumilus sp.]